MQFKQHVPILIKITTNFSCLCLLLFWTWLAIQKFLRQPISTYLSVTKGDDNYKIQFPHVTFCICDDDSEDFINDLHANLTSNSNFDFNEFVSKKLERVGILVLDVYFYFKSNESLVQYLYPTYNLQYGPCIGFNPEKLKIKVNEEKANNISLVFKLNSTLFSRPNSVMLYLHSKTDSADAMDTNPMVFVSKDKYNTLIIKKKVISAQSTKQVPCGEFDVNTCSQMKANAKIEETLNCKVPFFNTDNDTLATCKTQVLKKALDLFKNVKDQCMDVKPCNSTLYSIKEKTFDSKSDGISSVDITYSTFQVEHYITYISYDFQSLVAELGGLLGMTLGLAFSSLGNFVADCVKKCLSP